MKHCPLCGEELKDEMQYCPHCGEPQNPEKPFRDLWSETEAPEEAEDWTAQVPDSEIRELEEEPDWVAPAMPENWKPEGKPVRKQRKPWFAVLGIFLGLVLVGLGFWQQRPGKLPEIPGCGMYGGIRCTGPELVTDAREDWVELLGDGSLRMELLGSPCSGTWSLQGTTFEAKLENDTTVNGTIQQGTLTFPYQGLTFLLALPGQEPKTLPAPALRPDRTVTQREYDHWAGDYYGFMGIYDGQGSYADGDGEAFDVCCRIRVEEDTGVIALWSADNKLGERFCMADVLFTEGAGDRGRMMVQWGSLYDMELRSGAWVVDPAKSPVSRYEGMLCIPGRYISPENPENSFSYQIFLRPWGMEWEDVTDRPDLLPPGYDSWYLPLLAGGFLMPESF